MSTVFQNFTEYTSPEDLKRLKFITRFITHYLPEQSKILDVGCGTGNMAFQLANLNYQVLGIDIDEQSIIYGQKVYDHPNLTFLAVDAEDFEYTGQKFDAVVCSEVLEHLVEPEKMLKKITTLIKPSGILAATVPNGIGPRELLVTRPMIYLDKNAPTLWSGIRKLKSALGYQGTIQSKAENLDHLHFFTRKKITNLIASYGFELKKISSANFIESTFPISLITNRVKKLKEWDCKIADKLPPQYTSGFYMIWIKK